MSENAQGGPRRRNLTVGGQTLDFRFQLGASTGRGEQASELSRNPPTPSLRYLVNIESAINARQIVGQSFTVAVHPTVAEITALDGSSGLDNATINSLMLNKTGFFAAPTKLNRAWCFLQLRTSRELQR